MLPYLACYVGHADLRGTQYYLRLTAEGPPPGVADSREVGTLVTDRTEDRMGKVYPEELKKKAVELYRLDEQTTYAEVGRDLDVSGETVRNWARIMPTPAAPELPSHPRQRRSPAPSRHNPEVGVMGPAGQP